MAPCFSNAIKWLCAGWQLDAQIGPLQQHRVLWLALVASVQEVLVRHHIVFGTILWEPLFAFLLILRWLLAASVALAHKPPSAIADNSRFRYGTALLHVV